MSKNEEVYYAWWLGAVTVWTWNLQSWGHGFDYRSGRYQVVTIPEWVIICGQVNLVVYNQGQLSLPSLWGR